MTLHRHSCTSHCIIIVPRHPADCTICYRMAITWRCQQYLPKEATLLTTTYKICAAANGTNGRVAEPTHLLSTKLPPYLEIIDILVTTYPLPSCWQWNSRSHEPASFLLYTTTKEYYTLMRKRLFFTLVTRIPWFSTESNGWWSMCRYYTDIPVTVKYAERPISVTFEWVHGINDLIMWPTLGVVFVSYERHPLLAAQVGTNFY